MRYDKVRRILSIQNHAVQADSVSVFTGWCIDILECIRRFAAEAVGVRRNCAAARNNLSN